MRARHLPNRSVAFCLLTLMVLPWSTSCRSTTLDDLRERADEIPLPSQTRRPIDELLEEFGDMILAYSSSDSQIDIGIDFIPNDSGVSGELPSDLGFYVESIISGIGPTLSSHRMLPASTYVNTFGASTIQNPVTQPRPRNFTVRGCLMRATELGRLNRRVGLEAFGTRGNEQGDGEATWEDDDTITRLRVMLSLEGPDGSTLPGCAAMYDIQYITQEDSVAWAIFVSGSGIGGNQTTFVSQDVGHALYDVTAACLMDVIGNALGIPYDNLGAPFQGDVALRKRLRSQLSRLAPVEAQQNAKRLMFTSGLGVDMSSPRLTRADMGLASQEMIRQNLDPAVDADWVDFNMHLWDSIKPKEASKRVRELLIKNTRELRMRLEMQQQLQGGERVGQAGR